MAWRRMGWALVWVCGCSSSNPAFDPPLAGDTGSTVDTTTGSVDADAGSTTEVPTTGDDTALPVPGTCESARMGEQVDFRVIPGDAAPDLRACGATISLLGCWIENMPKRGWTIGGCQAVEGAPNDSVPTNVDLMLSPPPQQLEGTGFEGDVLFHHGPPDEGCKFEWGVIDQRLGLDEERLVWAGTNVLDPSGGDYPITADPVGPWLDNCECGTDVGPDECNEDYGPQLLNMCYGGWIACTDVAPEGEEVIVDVQPDQYGIIILEAFEHESAEVEGEYSHVVRLTTPIGAPG